MRIFYRSGCAAAILVALGGCSFQAALDKMVKPERQKELLAIGERFCTDPVSMTSQIASRNSLIGRGCCADAAARMSRGQSDVADRQL